MVSGLTEVQGITAVVGLRSLDGVSGSATLGSSDGSVVVTTTNNNTNINLAARNQSSFVFRPGGAASGNVYTSWALLYADLNATSGVRNIIIDDSLATATMPAGTYNLADCVLSGHSYTSNPNDTAALQLADQCFWTGFPYVQMITVNSQSSSPIITYANYETILIFLDNLATLTRTGSAEFIKIDNTAGTNIITGIIMKSISALGNGTAGKEVISAISCLVFIYLEEQVSVQPNTLMGDAASLYLVLYAVGSPQFNLTQPNMAGSIGVSLGDAALYHQYTDTYSIGADNVQTAIDFLVAGYGYPLSGSVTTTDNTPTVLIGSSGVSTPSAHSCFSYEAKVVAKRTDSSGRAAYQRYACFYREGTAGTAQQGSTLLPVADIETDATWDVTFGLFGNSVRLYVTGAVGQTIDWSGTINVTRVS